RFHVRIGGRQRRGGRGEVGKDGVERVWMIAGGEVVGMGGRERGGVKRRIAVRLRERRKRD
ncbi:hypothetical protein, partial [Neisseria sicca]|uniref:hypothetical protein n=1 Tax=Neisseria sicca TaxID=490 RepID=UPI001C992623